MATSTEQIELVVRAVTKAAEKELKKLNDELGKSDNQGKKNKKTFDELKTTWFKIAGVAATAGIAISKAFDLAKTASKFNQSVEAMETQFGVSADKILGKLREVSGGTISDFQLIEAANRSMALNVSTDMDQIAKLLEIARMRARAMGTDTTDAFNDIVTGIGRASPLILDNLGIITKGWAEEAKSAGVAYDAQFILNKVMAQGSEQLERLGGLALTDAERFQRMNAQLENSSKEIGQALLPLMVELADVISNVATYTSSMVNWFKKNKAVVDLLLGPLVMLIKAHIWLAEKMGLIDKKEANTFKNSRMRKKLLLEAERQRIEREKAMQTAAADEKAARDQETWNKEAEGYWTFTKQIAEYDRILAEKKKEHRGIDKDSYKQWSQYMMNTADKTSSWQFKVWKAFAVQQAIINMHSAALAGYRAMIGVPYVGPILAAAASAAALTFGAMQVKRISQTKPPAKAEHGALIQGSAGGSSLIAGENNKSELILPLEDEQAQEAMGGMGGVTINVNVENLMADEEVPRELASRIDAALYDLKRRGESRVL